MAGNVTVFYTAFRPFIDKIGAYLLNLEKQLEQQNQAAPMPYPLVKRIQDADGEYILSAIVEASLMKMARDLTERPLPLKDWNRYFMTYTDLVQDAESDDSQTQTQAHPDQRKIWVNEHGLDKIEAITRHAEKTGVSYPVRWRKNSPRNRLMIAFALQYTAESLPELPDSN